MEKQIILNLSSNLVKKLHANWRKYNDEINFSNKNNIIKIWENYGQHGNRVDVKVVIIMMNVSTLLNFHFFSHHFSEAKLGKL